MPESKITEEDVGRIMDITKNSIFEIHNHMECQKKSYIQYLVHMNTGL